MAQLNKIVLAATSGTLEFEPRGINPQTGVAVLSAASASGSDISAKTLTGFLNPAHKGRNTYKPQVRITYPVVTTVNDSEALTRTLVCNTEFSFPKGSTLAERKHVRELMIEALKADIISDMADNLNSIY